MSACFTSQNVATTGDGKSARRGLSLWTFSLLQPLARKEKSWGWEIPNSKHVPIGERQALNVTQLCDSLELAPCNIWRGRGRPHQAPHHRCVQEGWPCVWISAQHHPKLKPEDLK